VSFKGVNMAKCQGFGFGQRVRYAAVLGLLSLIEVWGALPAPVQAQDSRTAIQNPLPPAYWDAVEDARLAEPHEVFRNLTAITPHNSALSWDARGRVLVATWTTWDGYTRNVGNQLILTRDLWVTAVPDMRDFCARYAPSGEVPLAARLNQLLGLPPESVERAANRQVVEIWVEPQFLFRPSPDPEITDHEAELGFRSASEFVSVPSSYLQWFYAQFDQRYQSGGQPLTRQVAETSGTLPYPWTQLGYTYDWGSPSDWAGIDPGRPKEVGLSEFVIRQWSPISVKGTEQVEDYCR
jgi:hypothetical protein